MVVRRVYVKVNMIEFVFKQTGLMTDNSKFILKWLGHCATSRKVADSIPDGVTGIFY